MDNAFFYIIVFLLFAEIFASWTWMSIYFRSGIPVYRRLLLIRKFQLEFAVELERIHDSRISIPLLFRAMSLHEIAFREKVFGIFWLRYAPVMRGLIHVSDDRKQVWITGLLNWYVILLIALLPLTLSLKEVWPYFLLILAAVFITYLVQRYRYARIGDSLENLYGK